jgi:hypothetical protein
LPRNPYLATIAKEPIKILLSDEQRRELRTNGRIIRALDPETRTEFVLIRAELYERLLMMAYDDSPWTDEEMDRLASESIGSLDQLRHSSISDATNAVQPV